MNTKEIEIKNGDIKDIWNLIASISSKSVGNASFRWFIALNKSVFKPLVEALSAANEPSIKVKEFEAKRIEEVQKVATRDERGGFVTREVFNPITNQTNVEYVISPDKQKGIDDAVNALRGEYKKDLEEEKKRREEFFEFLKKTISVEVHTIDRKDIPADVLIPDQLCDLNIFTTNGAEHIEKKKVSKGKRKK